MCAAAFIWSSSAYHLRVGGQCEGPATQMSQAQGNQFDPDQPGRDRPNLTGCCMVRSGGEEA